MAWEKTGKIYIFRAWRASFVRSQFYSFIHSHRVVAHLFGQFGQQIKLHFALYLSCTNKRIKYESFHSNAHAQTTPASHPRRIGKKKQIANFNYFSISRACLQSHFYLWLFSGQVCRNTGPAARQLQLIRMSSMRGGMPNQLTVAIGSRTLVADVVIFRHQ